MVEPRRSEKYGSRKKDQARAALSIKGLNVYYGQSHCLQSIDLELPSGILAVVGRNGMGKTTLCNTIMGLAEARSGSIRFRGREISNQQPNEICNYGIGYVPQGRRVWPSLTVDEHLKLSFRNGEDVLWSVDRIYQTFPRLAERRNNGGGQLSGGEQQMLAIARALLVNPSLLIMDEPTEGLAPVIVQQVESMLRELADEDELSVLLIEQNIGVATEVSENVAIMVNGAINRIMPSRELAADVQMQQQLLGVGRHEEETPAIEVAQENAVEDSKKHEAVKYFSMPGEQAQQQSEQSEGHKTSIPNRWGANLNTTSLIDQKKAASSVAEPESTAIKPLVGSGVSSVSSQIGRTVLVVGTFDTKSKELEFLRDEIARTNIAVRTVDLSTSGKTSRCDVTPQQVASSHPSGSSAVFSNDRGKAITAMCDAFIKWLAEQRDIGGIISAGGSGGTALVTPGMRALPVGIPKLMVSTVASGDVGEYVGPSDIMMMHSVSDVQGINSISRQILRNAANAMAGAVKAMPDADQRAKERSDSKPSIGVTMFGVTTPCVQAVTKDLAEDYDCLVFHCTGTGGRAMESLVDSGELSAVIDITTTEVADMHVGGVFAADETRFDAIIRSRIPYIGSCGALDMVNFGSMGTVPTEFSNRNLYVHNPQVTLMRTTLEENRQFGQWIGNKLNQMEGPVRFLIPEGGVSLLDRPEQPFHDPDADAALFNALEQTVVQSANRKLIRVPANINDELFIERLLETFRSINQPIKRKRA